MFSTGKFASKSVRAYLNKNADKYADKIGKLDFDLDEVLKRNVDFPKEAYYMSKNAGTAVATVVAGMVSSNIITPILRNKAATKMQKKYLDKKVSKPNDDRKMKKQEFNSPKLTYNNTSGMKI